MASGGVRVGTHKKRGKCECEYLKTPPPHLLQFSRHLWLHTLIYRASYVLSGGCSDSCQVLSRAWSPPLGLTLTEMVTKPELPWGLWTLRFYAHTEERAQCKSQERVSSQTSALGFVFCSLSYLSFLPIVDRFPELRSY